MHFAQPGFLWFLLFLAVPVLIHLLNLQRTRKILFANTRILTEVINQTKKERSLKSLFLLALRLAAFFCLVLAFAQPSFTSLQAQESVGDLPYVQVLLDNSKSMYLPADGNRSPIDAALQVANGIPSKFQDRGWFQLVTQDLKPGQIKVSARQFKDQLTEVGEANGSKSLDGLLARINRSADGRGKLENQVYVFSDFQKSQSGRLADLPIDTALFYHFVLLKRSDNQNIFVDSIWLPQPLSIQPDPQQVRIKLGGYLDPDKLHKINLQLFDSTSLISGKVVEWKGNQGIAVDLPFRISNAGFKRCTLRVDDAFQRFDNEFYFVLKSPPPISVFLVGNGLQTVKKVFLDKRLFAVTQQASISNFNLVSQNDLIVLNLSDLASSDVSGMLRSWIEEGKNVVILSSTNPTVNEQLAKSLGLSSASQGASSKPEDWKIDMARSKGNFLSKAFKDLNANTLKPTARPTFWPKDGDGLLMYENGSPFLSRIKLGKGQLFWVASPMQWEDGTIAKHPLFVALWYNLAFLSAPNFSDLLFVRTHSDRALILPDTSLVQKEELLELRQGNVVLKCAARQSGKAFLLEIPSEQLTPGFWSIHKENKMLGMLAVNRSANESRLDFYSEEELKQAFADKLNVQITEVDASDQIAASINTINQEKSVWKYFILAALFFLLSEMAFSFYSQAKGTPTI